MPGREQPGTAGGVGTLYLQLPLYRDTHTPSLPGCLESGYTGDETVFGRGGEGLEPNAGGSG